MNLWTFAAILFVAIGSLLLFIYWLAKRRAGILSHLSEYRDSEETPGEILTAKSLPLRGKPDSIVRVDGMLIPVEIKTGKTPPYPYPNHTMQLMAYCLLVEEVYGIRPPGGYLKYPDREFHLEYTAEAEESVRMLVAEISLKKATHQEPQCSHPEHN